MTTSTFNIRLDDELRSQATQVLSAYGLTPTQAIKLFFNQIVSTKAVPLSFNYMNDDSDIIAIAKERLADPRPIKVNIDEL
ncbi:type II toxin-antitoxin system RelB/DinJ family antitoxin [Faucicola mancuniensis]|uniref:type II toxin-antitoxin system RelB/DinJ family antitoxin n=1 Tax=Faucicola mancuniensis TaxID=1309795 RepID=UPI0028E4CCAB|nr:type II toxin-antitoxin system RelB/DinJ family antitoxin [uncultured Moraxella sp.]